MKVCRCCGYGKECDEFHPYPRNLDGLQSFCKACQAAKKRAKYEVHAAARREDSLQRYRAKKAAGAITLEMLAAKTTYDRQYRAMNADKLETMKCVWRAENADLVRAMKNTNKAMRRSRIKEGDSSRTVRDWLALQARVCRWCGVDCSETFHIDHQIPLARGGLHVVANLCIACPTCNVRKHVMLPSEFLERHRCDIGMIT